MRSPCLAMGEIGAFVGRDESLLWTKVPYIRLGILKVKYFGLIDGVMLYFRYEHGQNLGPQGP
jgi:hypothetical protein